MATVWQCEHATTALWTVRFPLTEAVARVPGQAVICRACVLQMAGYPEELTATLDRVILEKRFGQVKITFQNGVPGSVFFDDALKVSSWRSPFSERPEAKP